MKTIAILALIGIAASAIFYTTTSPSSVVEEEFNNFLAKYKIGYGTTEEYNYRLKVFAENLEKIEVLNKADNGARFGVNKYADRTENEVHTRVATAPSSDETPYVAPKNAKSVDWTDIYTGPRDMTTGEYAWWLVGAAIDTYMGRYSSTGQGPNPLTLSAQQIIDCSETEWDGPQTAAFEYLGTANVCTDFSYKFTGYAEECKDDKCGVTYPPISGYKQVAKNDEDALLAELENGPINVRITTGIDTSKYEGGVLTDCKESASSVKYSDMTLVQANVEEGWVKLRGYWGEDWGEEGHMRLKIGQNSCLYAESAYYPIF